MSVLGKIKKPLPPLDLGGFGLETSVFGPNPPGAGGGASFLFFPKTSLWALGSLKGPPGSTFGPLGPLRALLVVHLGPWGP